jgi:acetyl esterase/lipase
MRIPTLSPRRGRGPLAALLVGLLLLAAACGATGTGRVLMAPTDGGFTVTRDIPYGQAPKQRLDVYRPDGAAGGPRPVVVYLFGGAWTNGTKDDPSSFALPRALAARGAVVVVPGYRLFPDTDYPGFMEDVAAGVAWTQRHAAELGGDPRAIFLAGHSSGAHMAMLLGLDPRWVTAAGGSTTPPFAGIIGVSGVYDAQAFDVPIIRPVFASAPDRRALLPASFLRPDMPPLLLATGGWDWMVPPGNTRRLAAAARAAGGRVEEHVYPGFGHFDILMTAPWVPSLAPAADDIAAFVRARSEVVLRR